MKMQKRVLSFFGLTFFVIKAFAFDLYPYWTTGNAGVGGVFKAKEPTAQMSVNSSLLNFYFLDLDSGISFSLSPFFIYAKSYSNGKNIEDGSFSQSLYIMSLVNAELAFNTLHTVSDKSALNLFGNVHWLDPLKISRLQVNAGLEFAMTFPLEPFNSWPYPLKFNVLSLRSGFRHAVREPVFFCEAKVDFGSFIYAIFKGEYERAKKEAGTDIDNKYPPDRRR